MEQADIDFHRTLGTFQYRCPTPEDGLAVWRLIQLTEKLEANSAYFYLIFCTDFARTCLVAEREGEMVGIIIGFHPPDQSETAFCWQIGVHPKWRGVGLASNLLQRWLMLPSNQQVRYVTATVATDNHASDRLFRRFADCVRAPCEVKEHFTEALIEPGHAPEPRYRIGPIDRTAFDQTYGISDHVWPPVFFL